MWLIWSWMLLPKSSSGYMIQFHVGWKASFYKRSYDNFFCTLKKTPQETPRNHKRIPTKAPMPQVNFPKSKSQHQRHRVTNLLRGNINRTPASLQPQPRSSVTAITIDIHPTMHARRKQNSTKRRGSIQRMWRVISARQPTTTTATATVTQK